MSCDCNLTGTHIYGCLVGQRGLLPSAYLLVGAAPVWLYAWTGTGGLSLGGASNTSLILSYQCSGGLSLYGAALTACSFWSYGGGGSSGKFGIFLGNSANTACSFWSYPNLVHPQTSAFGSLGLMGVSDIRSSIWSYPNGLDLLPSGQLSGNEFGTLILAKSANSGGQGTGGQAGYQLNLVYKGSGGLGVSGDASITSSSWKYPNGQGGGSGGGGGASGVEFGTLLLSGGVTSGGGGQGTGGSGGATLILSYQASGGFNLSGSANTSLKLSYQGGSGPGGSFTLGGAATASCPSCGGGGISACGCASVPTTLTLTVTNVSGCSCLAGTYSLTYNSSAHNWQSNFVALCTLNAQWFFQCASSPNWTLTFASTGSGMQAASSCSPFSWNKSGISGGVVCTGTYNASITG